MIGPAEYVQRWSTLHGGYLPKQRSVIGLYLRAMYAVARPLAVARIHPDLVSIAAVMLVALAPLLARGDLLLMAAALIAITGLLDGVDGAVAVLQRKESRWGGVLDSTLDRVAEAIYVAALIVLGAPAPILIVGLLLTFLQEYVRARAGAMGARDIGVISVWERPTRIALAALTFVGFDVTQSAWLLPTTSWVWLALSVLGLGQVTHAMRTQLLRMSPETISAPMPTKGNPPPG